MTTLLTTTATTNSNSTSTNTTTEKDSLTPRTTFSHTHSHNGNINHISPTYSKSLPEFARCVSFNNINPPAYDSDSPLNSPIYGSNDNSTADGNYTFSASSSSHPVSLDEFSFAYGRKNSNPNSYISKRKRLRLPPPPEKSILKNSVSSQQLEYNDLFQNNLADATINYHKEEELLDEEKENGSSSTSSTNSSPLLTAVAGNGNVPDYNGANPPRRKSLAGLTDEELMALDPQYSTSKTSNVDKFKFDNQQTYYLSPSSRRTSLPSESVSQLNKRQEYPTSNENNYKCISLSAKANNSVPSDYKRTILTIISGRKHTWKSLDWLVTNEQFEGILQDGDALVVGALVPLKYLKNNKKRSKASIDEYLFQKCSNLLTYLMSYITKLDLKVKVTVEFVLDYDDEDDTLCTTISTGKILRGNKYMIFHLFKQYQPHLVVLGNQDTPYNSKRRISSYCIKHGICPVIQIGCTDSGTGTRRPKPATAIRFAEDDEASIESEESEESDFVTSITKRIISVSDNACANSKSMENLHNKDFYKVKSMISMDDDEEERVKQDMKKKKRRESQVISVKSNTSTGNVSTSKPKKKSFWKKIGSIF
ncbi:hypothetical protein K6H09_003362 [Candida tropicalis]